MSEPTRSVWAVVPVKSFESAKSRLAPVLSPAERERLARSMFEHVLSVLRAASGLSGVLVVTDSSAVADAAVRVGANALLDPRGPRTLADCVDHAVDEVRRRGAGAVVVLVSDLPVVTTTDMDALIERSNRFDVVLVKDRGGEHTNALALRLDKPFRTSFGAGDSYRRHLETAQRLDLSVCELERPSVAFDVDTPEDYADYVRRPPDR